MNSATTTFHSSIFKAKPGATPGLLVSMVQPIMDAFHQWMVAYETDRSTATNLVVDMLQARIKQSNNCASVGDVVGLTAFVECINQWRKDGTRPTHAFILTELQEIAANTTIDQAQSAADRLSTELGCLV